MQRKLLIAVAAALLQTGCERPADQERPREPVAMPSTLAGVYTGSWPCSNCSAIEATLWLREDGSFFLRQRFVDDPAAPAAPPAAPSHALDRWYWDSLEAQAVLRGAGPERRFAVLNADRVQLRTPSPLPHILERDAAAPPFVDRLRLDGATAAAGRRATFTECLTGITWPVAEAGAFRELMRQQRAMNPRGVEALTTVEAHLLPARAAGGGAIADVESLVVDRFVTLKPGARC